ncbi:tyrosine-type recombinase/integrase [Falsiroseomonas bella]|uniref:tyrosine-type recombinase/integrase n=1 Tax=Falsiroseomonas bella TaxID=2184016 RepID=UPI002FCE3946
MKDRLGDLEPRAVAALQRQRAVSSSGQVFRRADGSEWHPDPKVSGAQLNKAFRKIARAAGIDRHVTLHMIRHSWASWHYCVHRDLKRLKEEGAWESLEMADRYAHLAPPGMAPEIERFWGRLASPAEA